MQQTTNLKRSVCPARDLPKKQVFCFIFYRGWTGNFSLEDFILSGSEKSKDEKRETVRKQWPVCDAEDTWGSRHIQLL